MFIYQGFIETYLQREKKVFDGKDDAGRLNLFISAIFLSSNNSLHESTVQIHFKSSGWVYIKFFVLSDSNMLVLTILKVSFYRTLSKISCDRMYIIKKF